MITNANDLDFFDGLRVEVFFNIKTHRYSVRALEGLSRGTIIAKVDRVSLSNVTFAVQPAGNAKLRRTGVKNVHAFVRGILRNSSLPCVMDNARGVAYYPLQYKTFTDSSTGWPAYTARNASLSVLTDDKGKEHAAIVADLPRAPAWDWTATTEDMGGELPNDCD